ncbi:hypothetical protein DOTSEDRAFT_69619 [Dothistroma septosporum NZE10]|uniref:Uncharacterized protein n=1 Tax=Dothistroma septosporum (strain NZE10 / CBS 128990) TaxID=675120 RepID=N1PWG1_DOTSN|nr:hypothetical protein DOTSEDRAFT_69619 [Dothistroma septosporum NZE10]
MYDRRQQTLLKQDTLSSIMAECASLASNTHFAGGEALVREAFAAVAVSLEGRVNLMLQNWQTGSSMSSACSQPFVRMGCVMGCPPRTMNPNIVTLFSGMRCANRVDCCRVVVVPVEFSCLGRIFLYSGSNVD